MTKLILGHDDGKIGQIKKAADETGCGIVKDWA